MKYLISIIGLFAVAGIVMIVILFKPNEQSASVITSQNPKPTSSLSAVSAQGHYARADLNLSAVEIARARQKQQLVEVVQFEQIQHEPEFIFKRADQAQQIYLRYDPSVIETRKVGEQLQFTVPALGMDYQLQIENMHAIDPDIMRWEGRVLADESHAASNNKRFSVMQSRTDRYSIIQIHSDQGSISAEIKNGFGVISNSPIEQDHEDVDAQAQAKI